LININDTVVIDGEIDSHEGDRYTCTPLPSLDDTIAVTDNYESDEMELETEETLEIHEHAYDDVDILDGISSDDEEQSLQCSQRVNGPPLYVLPATTDTYNSSITRSEHILATSAFAARHNLSDMAIKDLLDLLQLHMPEHNTGETNIHNLKNQCGFNKSYLTFHLYCDMCKKLFSDETDICKTPGCQGLKTDIECKKYFITSDIKKQLIEILHRSNVWEMILTSKSATMSENICDVRSGIGYKKLQEPGGFLHDSSNITFSMFTDGVPLFKSSGIQMWPVYILINEIPPKQRFTRKNMLLWGVWQGQGKPKMNMFLRPLITDLTDLYQNGLSVTIEKKMYHLKAMMILVTMDLQARAYLTGMTHHNGEYGCLYCEEPGAVVKSGAGTCRAYIAQEEAVQMRTDQSAKGNATMAHQTRQRHHGFIGLGVLHYLPYFSMTNNIVIDYMHGTLLGITKKLLELWFDHKHTGTGHSIAQNITEVDKILKSIQPPYMIHRRPRILSSAYHHWKASELRNWLLFYSIPCLKDYLPSVYFKHFCCLVEATYILLSEGITTNDLKRADTLLNFFVTNAAHLYGKNIVSLNVHNLTHLVHFVKMWGPLWCWSCFPFESFNGEIKKNIHGTGNVCRQIFWTFQAQKRIMQSEELLDEGEVRDYVQGMFEGREHRCAGKEAYQCKIVKTSSLKSNLDVFVRDKLKSMTTTANINEDNFFIASKVIRNGFYMYSSSCLKVKRQNSYTIAFEKSVSGHIAIEIEQFLVEKKSRCVFAVGTLVKSKGNVLKGYVPHIHVLEYR